MADSIDIKKVEEALIKSHRQYLFVPFYKAVKEYGLIEDGDTVAVAISGGKDSLVLAKLVQHLHRYYDIDFDVKYLAMDPGYTKKTRSKLENLLEELEIPAEIFETDIFEITKNDDRGNPCFLCARMRRGALYSHAQSVGANKLALGHHLDDVVETIMLNVLCGGKYNTMMPKLKSTNFEDMELIRPLYLIEEKSIISWRDKSRIEPLDCGCTVVDEKIGTKRDEIKELILELEDSFENVKMSIFRSADNVDLGAITGWKKDNIKYSFLDEY